MNFTRNKRNPTINKMPSFSKLLKAIFINFYFPLKATGESTPTDTLRACVLAVKESEHALWMNDRGTERPSAISRCRPIRAGIYYHVYFTKTPLSILRQYNSKLSLKLLLFKPQQNKNLCLYYDTSNCSSR